MKLYTLDVVGIGPFAQQASVDFRRFEDSGIFLIHGKTGSGKSSLLDAIVFAFYGDVAGEGDKRKDRIRSHYLTYRDKAYARIVFGAAGRIYRITREPDRINASGNTTYGKCTLEEVCPESDGSFTHIRTLATSKRETGSEVVRLLGLTRDQFTQTVLLPQGRFAQFLSAKSDARREVLQSIFGTQRFARYEAALLEKAREHTERFSQDEVALSSTYSFLEQSFERVEQAFEALRSADDSKHEHPLFPALPDALPALADDQASEDNFQRLCLRIQDVEKIVDDSLQSTIEILTSAEQELLLAQKNQAAADRLTSLKTRQASLDAESAQVKTYETHVDNARRVTPLMDAVHDHEIAWQRLHAEYLATQRTVESVSRQTALCLGTALRDVERNVKLAHEQWNETRIRIEPYVAEEDQIRQELEALDADTDVFHRDKEAVEAARLLLDSLPQELDEAVTELASVQDNARCLDEAQAQCENLRQRLSNALSAQQLETLIDQHTHALETALEQAQEAHNHATNMRSRWLQDAAASLATTLRNGQACAVCGSTTHPNPAVNFADSAAPVDRESVEEAQQAALRADQDVAARSKELAEIRSEQRDHLTRADGTAQEIQEALCQAHVRFERIEKDHSRLPELMKHVDTLKQQISSISEQVHSEDKRLADVQARLSERTDGLHTRSSALRQACGDFNSVSEHMKACNKHLESLAYASEALGAYRNQLIRWNDACAQLEQQYRDLGLGINLQWNDSLWMDFESGFDVPLLDGDSATHTYFDQILPELIGSEDARSIARQALLFLPASEIEELQKLITEHHHALASTNEELNDPVFLALTGKEKDLYEHCLVKLQAAKEENRVALTLHTGFVSAAEHFTAYVNGFLSQRTSLHEAKAQFAPLERLSRLAAGRAPENQARIALRTWVLINLFKDVLAAANHHLSRISDGRYELVHAIGTHGNVNHGLELEIIDYEVDKARDASTLSGGESFYCSLALALGLAEIVTGENGGIELQTMFIDEGFGSLDSQTLDNVMRVFHELHQNGRMIGIISHVSEMLAHIPDKIHVTRGAHGAQLFLNE